MTWTRIRPRDPNERAYQYLVALLPDPGPPRNSSTSWRPTAAEGSASCPIN